MDDTDDIVAEVIDEARKQLVDDVNELPSVTPKCPECDDVVSRRAAIDVAENAFVRGLLASPDIRKLPSVHPEPKWIPVSERLSDDLGDYLVSIKRIGWNMEEYVENDIAYWDDLEGFHKADEVLAWMPLPEPYRAERRTDARQT